MGGGDGRIVYRIEGDNSQYKDSINEVKSIASTAGGVMKGIFAGTTAVIGGVMTGTVALIKNVAGAYGEYEQLVGGIQSMFGETEKGIADTNRVMDMASEAWKNLTMSESQYYSQFMSTYPLINASISEGGDAIAETNKLLELSSDLANTFGYSTETAMNAINWALKGSYNYLDNLNIGIKGTKEGFLEAVNASGLFEQQITDISELTSEQIVQVLQYQANIYGVLGKTQDEAERTLQGSFKMLRSTWANFVTALGKDSDEIEQRLDEVIQAFDAVLNNIVPLVDRLLAHLPKAISMIASKLVELAPSLLKTAFNIFRSVVDIIFQQLPSLLKVISEILGQLVGLIIEYMPTFLDAVIQTVTSIITEIGDNADKVAETVSAIIVQVTDAILGALPQIIEALGQIFIALAQHMPEFIEQLMGAVMENFPIIFNALMEVAMAIIASLPEIIQQICDHLPEIISMVATALVDCAPMLVQATVSIVEGMNYAFLYALGALAQKIPEIFAELGKFIIDGWKGIANGVGNVVKDHAQQLVDGWNQTTERAKAFFKELLGIFKGIGQKMLQIGADIVNGIWNGIAGAWNRLVQNVRAKIKGLVAEIKNALKIRSPSRVFADEVGAMIPKGLAVGVEEHEGEAQKAVRGMTESMIGAGADIGMAVSPITSGSPDVQGLAEQLAESMNNIRVQNEIYLDGMSMARKLYDYQQKVQVERGQNFVPIY